MRADKPIGTFLLLWPTLWALLLAAEGLPEVHLLVVFVLGVFLMRSAGCVINDYADRHFDGSVERTSQRPLVIGSVTEKEALGLFVCLVMVAFLLVLTLNWQTIALSVIALCLAASYPFMKRYTHLPQVVLGAAFGWSIPMAFMASLESVPAYGWWLYLANLLWTVAYDTQYAMVDRDDDLKIGIKSTAILFGRYDNLIIALLQVFTLIILLGIGQALAMQWPYYLSLLMIAGLFMYQSWLTFRRARGRCFQAFLNNHYVGMILAMGIAGHLWMPAF